MSDPFFDPNNDFQGILGLGVGELANDNTDGYVPALSAAGLNNIFAFELCDNTGANASTLWLGGDGAVASAQYTPPASTVDDPFYVINVNSLSLGSTNIVTDASTIFKQPLLDTGTSIIYVPNSVYKAFKTDLAASAEFKAVFGNNTFSDFDCVADASVTDAQVESGLPPIVLSLPSLRPI
jgi:hypothetical protein